MARTPKTPTRSPRSSVVIESGGSPRGSGNNVVNTGTGGGGMLYLVAALQWGLIALLSVMKPNLTSHYFVSTGAEQCQGECRLWALLFWGSQLAMSLGYYYIYARGGSKLPFVVVGVVQKMIMGLAIIVFYFRGVAMTPLACGGVLDLVMAVALLWDLSQSEGRGAAKDETGSWHERLKGFAECWWYPWMVGSISGVNNFTLILSAPLVGLYIAGVLARPGNGRFLMAFANAFGTTMGISVLIYYLLSHKEEFDSAFKQLLTPEMMAMATSYADRGVFGVVIFAAMPLILHPIVVIGIAVNMSIPSLIVSILVGRFIKYSIMAQCAVTGSGLIKFFGSAAAEAAAGGKEA